jgi:hypothetical protein
MRLNAPLRQIRHPRDVRRVPCDFNRFRSVGQLQAGGVLVLCVLHQHNSVDILMDKFKVGDIVVLNEEWGRHNCYAKSHPVGKIAEVVGHSRTPNCTAIVFEGQVTRQTFHNSFLDIFLTKVNL